MILVDTEEVLAFVEGQRLFGRGVGWLDAYLLASALLSHAALFTLDLPLSRLAAVVGVSA